MCRTAHCTRCDQSLVSFSCCSVLGVVVESEGAWFASILNIGALIGCFIAGWSMEKFGRKLSLMLLAVPFILGWLLIFSASTVPLLYLGRLFGGVGGTLVQSGSYKIDFFLLFSFALFV